MKTIITFVFTLFVSILFGQVKKCYNDSWKEVKCSGEYSYYRIIPVERISNGLYTLKDYYHDGTLQMEGAYSDNLYLHKEGEFKYYYENGKISLVENYTNNKPVGKFKKWYSNGQLKWEGRYTDTNGNSEYTNFWKEDGIQAVKDGNGIFFSKNDDGSFIEGNLKEGKEDGLWKGYIKELDITYEDRYSNGMFIEGTSQHAGKKYTYTTIQEIAYPQKGNNDLRNFIANNFRFPNKILKENYSSAVVMIITIDESGKIFDVLTENIVDEKVKERLINIVKKYPGKFNLPKVRGVPNKQKLRLSVILSVD